MGLHADAVALAKITGKDVKECKKALKAAGDSLRNATLLEKGLACFGAPEEAPLVEKELDPEPESQVQDPEPEPQAPKPAKKAKKGTKKKKGKSAKKVVETHDDDHIGTQIDDAS